MTLWSRTRQAGTIIGCIACVAVAAAEPVQAATPAAQQFDALPAAGSATDERGSYFVVDSPAGETIRQTLRLENQSSSSVTLDLRAAAASTGPLGGVTYDVEGAVAASGGRAGGEVSWLKLGRDRVTVGAGKVETVSFTVRLGPDAASGVHLAGIAIEERARAAATATGTAGVSVRSRRVIAVQASVPGRERASLRIERVTASPRGDAMYLLVHLSNDGNTLLKGKGRIAIEGEDSFKHRFAVDTSVPATSIEYPIRWNEAPSRGSFPAAVEVAYGDGGVARWSGDVVVGATALKGFDERTGAATSRRSAWQFAVAGLGAAICSAMLWAVVRRRLRPCGDATDEAVLIE